MSVLCTLPTLSPWTLAFAIDIAKQMHGAVLRSRGDRARQAQARAVDAWNERGANPGQRILPIKATATGPAMAPPSPPRPVWPYQHSAAAAAFPRQCATPHRRTVATVPAGFAGAR